MIIVFSLRWDSSFLPTFSLSSFTLHHTVQQGNRHSLQFPLRTVCRKTPSNAEVVSKLSTGSQSCCCPPLLLRQTSSNSLIAAATPRRSISESVSAVSGSAKNCLASLLPPAHCSCGRCRRTSGSEEDGKSGNARSGIVVGLASAMSCGTSSRSRGGES